MNMQQENRWGEENSVYQALLSIYTGIFWINLKSDSYKVIHSSSTIATMLKGIESAQQAINYAIQQTVFSEEILDMISFVNLVTLSDRMRSKKILNTEYRGNISGWVRGNFIEVERDQDGNLTQILYTYQIIDKKKRKELEEKKHLTIENTELQRARDAVYELLNSGSYICNYDKTGRKLLNIKYSDALRKLYGYSGKEEAPDTWDMWLKSIAPEDKKYVVQSYLSALTDQTGNTNYNVTYRALKKDGTIRWHRAAGHIIRREDGTADSCYGFVMDVDEQKKASDQLKEALKMAELANKAKTSFLSRMSHDIRTPMNGIMGLIEINEKHADDVEFTTQNRRKAKIAAQHLLSLINDILQLSKLEDPEIELSESPFNMTDIINDIFTIVEMKANEHGINIQRKDEEDAFRYPYVWGSPLHVRQIYLNILSNAIKYNKKNGKILCKASAKKIDQEHILFKIKIKDTGIGMSEEFLQHIFDPFTREHEEEMTGRRQGTGLGMSIVKQLVDKMNGTIHVESELGKGTCFKVEIPFKLACKDDMISMEETDTACDLTGRHILLVEDNELNMDIAETLLRDAGAKITKAVNGKQALDIFLDRVPNTFDVILMDIMMPVMDGYEATRRLRALDREDAKTIPIIAMTANAFMEDVKKAKEEGMNDHLAKPLDIQKMLSVITKNIMN